MAEVCPWVVYWIPKWNNSYEFLNDNRKLQRIWQLFKSIRTVKTDIQVFNLQ